MRHAYLITIHKNFRILERLMELLNQKGTDFYILIDKKANVRLREVCTYFPDESQIIELEPAKINWGGGQARLKLN